MVTVGNWRNLNGSGWSNNIPFPTSFQNSISALYSYRAPVQPALGPLCTLCTHEPVLRFICRVGAQHVQRCSEQASRYNIQLSNRTGWLWWVTEQNKDGAKSGCDVLEGRSTHLSFFSFFLYYAYPIVLNDRLCQNYLFFSAALFTVLTARC